MSGMDAQKRTSKSWADAAAPSLILLSLLVAFLRYHRYPLPNPETLLCVLILALTGLAAYGLALLRRETLYPLILGLLILIFADAQFLVVARLAAWTAEISPVVAGPALLVGFFAYMFLVFAIRRVVGRVAAAVFGVMLLTTVLLPSGRIRAGESVDHVGSINPALPPVLHLVLDEQIGLEGIPDSIEGGAQLRADLSNLFRRFGFTVYERAFSQYSESQLSLASLVNGEVFLQRPDYVRSSLTGYSVDSNRWLSSLAAQGYSLRIYQSGWIDFCDASDFQPDYCYTYPTNSVSSLLDYDLGPVAKTRLILPRLFKGTFDIFQSSEPQLSALSTLSTLERVARDIRSHQSGSAFFVHLMLPHYAYIFDAACRPRPAIETWANVGDLGFRAAQFNTDEERKFKYPLYFAQVRCLMGALDDLFQEMEELGILDRATVIVHGDHGSRLATKSFRFVDPLDLTDRDVIDLFSTLLAIHRPGGEAATIPEQVSLQEVFAREMLRRRLEGPTDVVIVRSSGNAKKPLAWRPMPRLD